MSRKRKNPRGKTPTRAEFEHLLAVAIEDAGPSPALLARLIADGLDTTERLSAERDRLRKALNALVSAHDKQLLTEAKWQRARTVLIDTTTTTTGA